MNLVILFLIALTSVVVAEFITKKVDHKLAQVTEIGLNVEAELLRHVFTFVKGSMTITDPVFIATSTKNRLIIPRESIEAALGHSSIKNVKIEIVYYLTRISAVPIRKTPKVWCKAVNSFAFYCKLPNSTRLGKEEVAWFWRSGGGACFIAREVLKDGEMHVEVVHDPRSFLSATLPDGTVIYDCSKQKFDGPFFTFDATFVNEAQNNTSTNPGICD